MDGYMNFYSTTWQFWTIEESNVSVYVLKDILYLKVYCTFHQAKISNSKQTSTSVSILFLVFIYWAVGRLGLASRLHRMILQRELPTDTRLRNGWDGWRLHPGAVLWAGLRAMLRGYWPKMFYALEAPGQKIVLFHTGPIAGTRLLISEAVALQPCFAKKAYETIFQRLTLPTYL